MVTFRSTSRNFLRHSFWRGLRWVVPGRLWSFLYSLRERLLAPRLIASVKREIPGERATSESRRAKVVMFEKAWKEHGAVGKFESGYSAHYAHIHDRLESLTVENILEIGVLGGGSHRAWRDIFPKASVYGFDIDPATVIREARLETFVGDQLSPTDLTSLKSQLPEKFELIVDDGWHQPEAGVNSLRAFLPSLADGGYYVVEDIDLVRYKKVWTEVAGALPSCYLPSLVELDTPASQTAIGGRYGLFVVTTT